ncbi:serine protease inhibitor Cvsi-2-like [Haliotis rufescens]|uniref:serine protease inhibitor Cvsi-2-like n=1 Tax=Haliotis rufescens TaxID=6454 RepID=UPI001EB0AE0B|nr:serine protease inhibitor Cvsi-2-like [Haliotis rufescens]
MKCTLVLAAVCAVVVLVTSERCSNAGDCSHVSCDSSTTLGCSHGECTCLEGASTAPCPQTTCAARSDCDSCSCHGNRQHHCFDERCTCGFGFGK